MATKQKLRDNLYKALGLFIEAIRPFIVSLLQKEAGPDKWDDWYLESLYPNQQEHWKKAIESGSNPETLIDFNNLKGFALKYKNLLRDDFDKKANSLPTWFEEINEIRNKCYHHQEMSEEEVQRAFSNMILILRMLEMDEVEQAISALKENKRPAEAKKEKQTIVEESVSSYGTIPWFKNVEPHLDIKQGRLDESVFAANLGDVALRSGREIYQNPAIFFEKTYFTSGLKSVAKRVIQGLNGGQDAENRVISLETGFGGGKTHTLISLYHLADLGKTAVDSEHTSELIEYTGKPEFDNANVAVFTNNTNDPTQGREKDGIHIRTIWGELAYQLGGKEAYDIIRANDENQTAPKGLFKKVIEKTKPALILIDELADYCVSASGVKVGDSNLSDQTMSFVQELTEAIAGTDRCVAVVTLPASAVEVGGTEEAARILNVLSNRLKRIGVDAQPVSDEEIFEVIRRRLFEDLGESETIEKIASQYMQKYREYGNELPAYASRVEYKNQLMKSYPFHPELINMFRVRWASHHDFQRTRGVLRVLASIVSDLWKRQGSLTGSHGLIHTSDVNFSNLDALVGELKRLYGNGYEAVITADVAGGASNSFKIDQDKPEYGQYNLTQGICATILLGSFGRSGSNQGISIEEIKLCVMKPQVFSHHNSVNGALDALESTAHYLYYSSTGSATKFYWFYTKPNINILINQTRGEIKDPEIESEILERIQQRAEGIHLFNVLINPNEDIPEQKKPSLVILGPKYQVTNGGLPSHTKKKIEQIATKRGNSDRIYRNTILFLVPTELGFSKLSEVLKEYLACQRIREEYKNQIDEEQHQDLRKRLDESGKKIEQSLVSAYTKVIKFSAKEGFKQLQIRTFKDRLDYQVNSNVIELLKEEEWLLEGIGITTLKKHNLYPTKEEPVQVQSIYEAFLRYDDKPMITGVDAIQTSLLRYCQTGEFAIAAGTPGDFTRIFYKQAPAFFDATEESYWLVDRSLYKEEEKAPEYEDFEKPKPGEGAEEDVEDEVSDEDEELQIFKSISISGSIDIANYHQVFTSFINPLKNHKVEIQIKVTGKSTQTHPITEKSDAYKITKESAKQLGLDFDVEE